MARIWPKSLYYTESETIQNPILCLIMHTVKNGILKNSKTSSREGGVKFILRSPCLFCLDSLLLFVLFIEGTSACTGTCIELAPLLVPVVVLLLVPKLYIFTVLPFMGLWEGQ